MPAEGKYEIVLGENFFFFFFFKIRIEVLSFDLISTLPHDLPSSLPLPSRVMYFPEGSKTDTHLFS